MFEDVPVVIEAVFDTIPTPSPCGYPTTLLTENDVLSRLMIRFG